MLTTLITSVLDVCAPRVLYNTHNNLVIALGWSLHLCITQHPLFTSVIQGWGPRASPSNDVPLYQKSSVTLQAGPNPDGFVPNEGSSSEVVDGHGV